MNLIYKLALMGFLTACVAKNPNTKGQFKSDNKTDIMSSITIDETPEQIEALHFSSTVFGKYKAYLDEKGITARQIPFKQPFHMQSFVFYLTCFGPVKSNLDKLDPVELGQVVHEQSAKSPAFKKALDACWNESANTRIKVGQINYRELPNSLGLSNNDDLKPKQSPLSKLTQYLIDNRWEIKGITDIAIQRMKEALKNMEGPLAY